MKTLTAGLTSVLFLMTLAACQAGAVANVLELTATPGQPTASPVPATPTPSPTAPTLEPTLPAASPTAEPTQPAASPTATGQAVEATAASAAPTSPLAAEKTCQDMAAFYADISVPDGTLFRAGDAFTKTWRFRNTGECTWTPAYSVIFSGGEVMNAPLSAPFPREVAPGEQVDISIPMQAPARGGEHVGAWEFADAGGRRFGTGFNGSETFWVAINVSFVDSQGAAIPAPSANPVGATTPGTIRISGATPGGAQGASGANSPALPAAASGANSPALPAGCAAAPNPGFESQVIDLVNLARRQNGLPPLGENAQLDAAARRHSADMACNNFLNHTGTDGSTWYDRLAAQGYAYNDAMENIYAGSPDYGGDPKGAMQWWLNSAVHRANILNPTAGEIGVGYVFSAASDFGGYYTIVFTRP